MEGEGGSRDETGARTATERRSRRPALILPSALLALSFRAALRSLSLPSHSTSLPSDDGDQCHAQGVQDGLQPGACGVVVGRETAAAPDPDATRGRPNPSPLIPLLPLFSPPPLSIQTHFVRNETFKKAADSIQGPARKIFIEFLERSCTAEFSGFLLYKELARRLKKTNPAVAEIFALLSRDEARHAGFINKALADFNLALDLGFLTKNRTYT